MEPNWEALAQEDAKRSMQVQAVRGSVTRGMDYNPDEYAKALKLAARTGVAPDMAQEFQPEVQKAADLGQIDFFNLVAHSPAAAKWLANQDNAAIAHDDIGTLTKLEESMSELTKGWDGAYRRAGISGMVRQIYDDLNSQTWDMDKQILLIPAKTMGGFMRGLAGLSQGAGQLAKDAKGPNASMLTKLAAYGLTPTLVTSPGSADLAVKAGKGFREYLAPIFTDPSVQAHSVPGKYADFIGGIAGTMGKAMLSGPLAPVTFGAEAGGNKMGDALDTGATGGQALVEGAGSGLINAGMAFIPGGKVDGSLRRVLTARALRGVALGTGTTLAENALTRIHRDDVHALDGMQENLASFLGLELAGVLQHRASLDAAVKHANESKLAQRSPEAFRELVKQTGEDQSVLIPADAVQTYFQEKGLDPVAVMDAAGVKNYAEALAAGTDVVVPVEGYMTALREHHGGLRDDIRFAPGEHSPREIANLSGKLPEMERALSSMKSPETSPAFQRIYENAYRQLVEVGQSDRVAEIQAKKEAAWWVTQASRSGMEPEALRDAYDLRITRPSPGETGSLVDRSLGRLAVEEEGQTLYQRGDGKYSSGDEKRSAKMRRLAQNTQAAHDSFRAKEHAAGESAFSEFEASIKEVQAGDIHSDPKGFIQFLGDRRIHIGLLEKADLSTLVHEFGHMHFEILSDLTERQGAPAQMLEDHKALLRFVGAKDRKLTKEQHEKLARAEETYFLEGKAPSQTLGDVFTRVKHWLKVVYRKLTSLDVKLTDDVRRVFDRMYATDAELEQARREIGATRLFLTPEEAGMSQAEFKLYEKQLAQEAREPQEMLERRAIQEAMRERETWWADESSTVRAAVTGEVDSDAVYQAFKALSEGKMEDGAPIKLNKEALVRQFGGEVVKDLPRSFNRLYSLEGGLGADAAAELLGFRSGESLVEAMKAMEPRKERIERLTQERMKAVHGDLMDPETLAEVAQKAIHETEPVAKMIELRALKRLQQKTQKVVDLVVKDQARAESFWSRGVLNEVPPIETFRKAAVELIQARPMMDLDPYSYFLAQQKASREAREAWARKDYAVASDAIQRDILNHFLYREALNAKERSEETRDYLRKFGKASFREMLAKAGGERGQLAYLDAADEILSRFDLARVSNVEIGRRSRSIADWAALQEANGETVAFDAAAFDAMRPKNWRELTLPELEAVTDALKNIEAIARNQLGFIRDGKQITFEQAIRGFVDSAQKNLKQKAVPRKGADLRAGERVKSALNRGDAYVQKLKWLVDTLDAGDINGPARANITAPIDDASGRIKDAQHKIYAELKRIEEVRPAEDVRDMMESSGVTFPGMDRPLTRMQLVGWAHNLGTEENFKVVTLGEGLVGPDGSFRPEFFQALQEVRPSEWAYIQGHWQALASLKDDIAAHALRTTGILPKWKDERSFSVKTKNGEEVKVKGGYWPLGIDSTQDVRGELQEDLSQIAVGKKRPTTSKSHLQKATGATYRANLDYTEVLTKHLQDVIQTTYASEAIDQVYRFIENPTVKETIKQSIGPEVEREFLPWLQDFVKDGRGLREDSGFILKSMMRFKTGMVVSQLGGNAVSMAVQVLDPLKPLVNPDFKGGATGLLRALAELSADRSLWDKIREKSPNTMRYYEESFNRDIKEMMEFKGPFDSKMGAARLWFMQAFSTLGRVNAFTAWHARYRQGMADHGEEARAIAESDRLVDITLQSGEARNMSPMMRSPYLKPLTAWAGDASVWYGLLSRGIRGADPARVSKVLLALVAEQVIADVLIRNRRPDEGESWLAFIPYEFGKSLFNLVPFLGDAGQYALDTAYGKPAKFTSPVLGGLESALKHSFSGISYLKGKKDFDQAVAETLAGAGVFMGVPGDAQFLKSWNYVHRVQKGEEPTPSNPAEAVHNTVTGKHTKRK